MKPVKGIALTIPGVQDLLKVGFDAFEIHPCKIVDVVETKKGKSFAVEQCEPEEAEFYSVFIHLVGAGLDCIADCETEAMAEDLVKFLKALCLNYKPA